MSANESSRFSALYHQVVLNGSLVLNMLPWFCEEQRRSWLPSQKYLFTLSSSGGNHSADCRDDIPIPTWSTINCFIIPLILFFNNIIHIFRTVLERSFHYKKFGQKLEVLVLLYFSRDVSRSPDEPYRYPLSNLPRQNDSKTLQRTSCYSTVYLRNML
jgi:hypothetical protein